MVQLSLSTTKGNSGSRHFPYTGFLGLTSIRVEGIVRTRFDEDRKPIPAKALTVSVRAYESRQTRMGGTHTRLLVDYSQTLWRKPDGQQFADLGEFESPFRITLPKRVAGFSTANYQDYRTYWRVEAVLEHVPMASVGSRIVKQFDLPLIRHDIPPPLPPPTPPQSGALTVSSSSTTPTLSHATNKPRAPVLHYNLSTPPNPIGPSDLLFTSVFIRPLDPSVLIRSASLLVERRIDLHDVDPPLQQQQQPPQIIISTSLPEREAVPEHDGFAYNAPSHSTTTVDSLASTGTSGTTTSRTPLIPTGTTPPNASSSAPSSSHSQPSPPTPSHKTVVSTVAAAEGTMFALDRETGVWSKTISLQWPAARSHSRWAMGETMRGSLGAVSFWVRVKVIVTSPSGTESIDLAPRELSVVLTNDAERRHALAQYAEMRNASASKSRASTSPSPNPAPDAPAAHRPAPLPLGYTPPKSAEQRSPTRQSSSSHGRSPPPATPTSTSSHPSTSSKREKSKKPRRPHTSAGPRDSVDVRVGGGVPVPSPAPVPANGYTTTTTTSPTSPAGPSTPHARSSFGSARYSPDHDTSEGASALTDAPAFQSLNTDFTGLNGIGGPRAMALRRRAAPEDAPLVLAEVVAGVRMERVQTRVEVVPSREDNGKSELIRAWEEELVRIEKASRRSSNVLAFWRRKERAPKEEGVLKARIAA